MINIIEIGPGNGISSVNLLNTLQGGIKIIQYTGVDFSKNLLGICEKRVKQALPNLPATFYTMDVEIQSKKLSNPGIAAAAFLIGNTLGNVENPKQTLSNIHKMLNSGDLFIIGVSLLHDDEQFDYTSDYLNQTFYDAVLEPFKMAGINTEGSELTFTFDKETSAIVGNLSLKEGQPSLGIKANQKIRCFLSRRFTVDGLNKLLGESGFNVIENSVSSDGGVCLTVSVVGA